VQALAPYNDSRDPTIFFNFFGFAIDNGF